VERDKADDRRRGDVTTDELLQFKKGTNGRDRDRTDDLYRVKVALIPTELRARNFLDFTTYAD
jgi:hypothetical protein